MNLNPTPSRLIKASKWSQFHEWPTQSALRWIIFNADKNGFRKAIRKVGKSVLIDEAAFYEWILEREARSRKS